MRSKFYPEHEVVGIAALLLHAQASKGARLNTNTIAEVIDCAEHLVKAIRIRAEEHDTQIETKGFADGRT